MVPVRCISRSQELKKIDFLTKNLNNLLVRNHIPLVILYQDCSSHLDSWKNMAARGAGLIFPIYPYRKLSKSSRQKPLDQFQYNFAEVFLWWSSTMIVQVIWIRQKNMAARGPGLFSLYIHIENFQNLLVRNHWTDFYIILQKCSFGDPLPRLFKPFGFVKKTWPPGVGLIFAIYLYRKL